MEEAIVVRYMNDKAQLRREWSAVIAGEWIMYGLAGIFFVSGPLSYYAAGAAGNIGFVVFLCTMGLLIAAICPGLRWMKTRAWEKSPARDQVLCWRVTPRLISCEVGEGGGLLRWEFRWPRLEQITEFRNGFVIKPAGCRFAWLPFLAFENPAGTGRFREMAVAAGAKIIVSKSEGPVPAQH